MAKKKRSRNLLFLTLLLALLVGATALVMTLNPEEESSTEESEVESTEILSIDEAAVNSIAWTVNGEDFVFSKSGEDWIYDPDPNFPLDQSVMDTIFTDLSSLLAYNTIENVSDLSEYGLDAPTVTVTIGTDSETVLHIGDAAPMDSLRYLRINDDPNVYLVGNSILSDYNDTLDELIAMESIPSFSNHQSITVTSAESELALTCVTNTEDDTKTSTWYCGEQELDASLVQEYCQNISSLSWQSCAAYKVSDEDLSLYGLDVPQLCATVVWYDEDSGSDQSFTLEIGSYVDETNAACYARIGGSDMVYTIDAAVLDALGSTTVNDLITSETAE